MDSSYYISIVDGCGVVGYCIMTETAFCLTGVLLARLTSTSKFAFVPSRFPSIAGTSFIVQCANRLTL